MARINIEDDLYKDRRFFDLMMRLKSADLALGVLVRAWVTAQKWYVTPSKMIPEKEWKKQSLPEDLFEVGLAKRVDGFVYVSGSEQQFAWLEQRVHAGRKGGLKSGKQRRHSVSDAALRHGARTVVNKAVKSGELIKPEFCQDCGFSGLIEGHHQDYSKPLEVMWLCKKCHTNTHRLLRNSKHIEANEAVASRNEAGVKQNEGNETLLSLPLSLSLSLPLSQSQTISQKQEKTLESSCKNDTGASSYRVPQGGSPRGCIPQLDSSPQVATLLSDVTQKLQLAWTQAYPDTDWIVMEILKANAWMEANPRKRPKNFGPFMNNWLSKGWEHHRKGIPSRRMTNSEVNAQSLAEMAQKVAEGKL